MFSLNFTNFVPTSEYYFTKTYKAKEIFRNYKSNKLT